MRGDFVPNFIARYYNSRTGTFCSADPLAGSPDDPQSWNRYPYGRNDPIAAVGLIEAVVVFPRGPNDFLLLDGHSRLDVLRATSAKEVRCTFATDDEAYTYNRRVNHAPPVAQDFLKSACDEERESVFDAIATHLAHQDKALGTGGANKAARKLMDERWEDQKLQLVSGKAIFTRLNTWVQEHYQTSVGVMAIAKAFQPNDIPSEVRDVVTMIEQGAASGCG